jgi:hypothetical protein
MKSKCHPIQGCAPDAGIYYVNPYIIAKKWPYAYEIRWSFFPSYLSSLIPEFSERPRIVPYEVLERPQRSVSGSLTE